jgi:hypothetical protein
MVILFEVERRSAQPADVDLTGRNKYLILEIYWTNDICAMSDRDLCLRILYLVDLLFKCRVCWKAV